MASKKARLEGWVATGILGSGAYGTVVRITTASGRCAAIKILNEAQDTVDCQDVVREVFGSSFCRARHSVWVNSRGVGIFMDVAVSSLEFHDFQRAMPAPVVAHLLRPVVMELRALHRRKIMHRDIKPGNILIMSDLTCCLADFGLALNRESSTDNAVVSLWYRSPELLLKMEHGFAADVWALGMLLVKCLTGWPLIQVCNEAEKLQAVTSLCLQLGAPDWKDLHSALPSMQYARAVGTIDWMRISDGPYSSLCAELVQQCLKMVPHERATMETLADHPFWSLELDTESKDYLQRFYTHLAGVQRPTANSKELFEQAFDDGVDALVNTITMPPPSGLPVDRLSMLVKMLQLCHVSDMRWQVAAYAMWVLDCCAAGSDASYFPAAAFWTVSAFMEDVRVSPLSFTALLDFFSAPHKHLKRCVLKVIKATRGTWPDLTRMETLVKNGSTGQQRFRILASCLLSPSWHHTDVALQEVQEVHADIARLFEMT